jgi:hypothetical protein
MSGLSFLGQFTANGFSGMFENLKYKIQRMSHTTPVTKNISFRRYHTMARNNYNDMDDCRNNNQNNNQNNSQNNNQNNSQNSSRNNNQNSSRNSSQNNNQR